MSNDEKLRSIGDVARDVGVETHTIRFWCQELGSEINVVLRAGGRRYFIESEVNKLKKLKKLLYNRNMKIREVIDMKLLNDEKDKISCEIMASTQQIATTSNIDYSDLYMALDILNSIKKYE